MKDLYLMLYNFGFGPGTLPLPEQLKVAKELKYQGVEMIGAFTEEVEALLGQHGLKVIEAQRDRATGELVNIERMQKLGIRYITGEEGYFDRETALETAQQLNDLGKKCKPYGFKVVTHNHTGEFMFNEKDGEYCWETVAKNTDPELVSFKLDIGWATIAGADCNYLIQKYPGRVEVVHVKPATKILGPETMIPRKRMQPPADGKMPDVKAMMAHVLPAQGPMKDYVCSLQSIMETAEKFGAKVFSVERDCFYVEDRVQVMKEDAEYIRTFW